MLIVGKLGTLPAPGADDSGEIWLLKMPSHSGLLRPGEPGAGLHSWKLLQSGCQTHEFLGINCPTPSLGVPGPVPERKKELIPFTTAWMELESIMLSEISQKNTI